MFRKLALTTGLAVCTVAAAPAFAGGDCGGVNSGNANLNELNPYYYNGGDATKTTDSGIPHLPAYYGQMQTNDTYRFFNVNEMVATMIGEGKHGMWRYQDNGTVREYLKKDATGLSAATSVDDILNSGASALANYTHHDPEASWAGYRSDAYAPAHSGEIIDQNTGITDNKTPGDASDDYRVWIDLPISHAKYDAKTDGGYDSHAPIDLPGWYCTMSNAEYPNARAAVRFAFAQDGANKVGPLGERAGLDIKENYLNILRLELFPDANAWVNTSGDADVIDWEAVDAKRTPYEVYLVERPFFNEEYLFYVVVFADRNEHGRNFSYIRPDGAYYEHLMDREANGEDLPWFNTRLRKNHPKFATQQNDDDGWYGHRSHGKKRATPVNLFGTHHPGGQDENGVNHTITNGACPAMGGDYGASHYGAAWPNNYQEISPLCDAVMLDIKAFANLDGEDWNNAGKYLPNATVDGQQNSGDHDSDGNALTRSYVDNAGKYGVYTDEYLLERNAKNPEAFTATGTQSKTYQTSQDAVSAKESLPFASGQ